MLIIKYNIADACHSDPRIFSFCSFHTVTHKNITSERIGEIENMPVRYDHGRARLIFLSVNHVQTNGSAIKTCLAIVSLIRPTLSRFRTRAHGRTDLCENTRNNKVTARFRSLRKKIEMPHLTSAKNTQRQLRDSTRQRCLGWISKSVPTLYVQVRGRKIIFRKLSKFG